ncbi:hypothetical protein [Sneathiella chinensis]|uniref:Uncharacterized protein n=1 Tax=Sneathiella chinensis TaxID=349750 RepID=A0ABQ5UAD0_9PROT|nr:hypothetical protein [Sneathiella chinensis]GLQ07511.1 hypothetical protein GCM10007924_27320 [Sneathiella chinensis]
MKSELEIVDLAGLDLTARAEAGAVLALRHPVTEAVLPVQIRLKGQDSETFRAILRQQIDAQLASGAENLSAAELEKNLIRRLAALTMGWDNVILRGEAVPFSVRAAEALYSEHVWVREQVARFVEDRSRFFTE